MDQSPTFSIVLFIHAKEREADDVVDWYKSFLQRTWPTQDGAIDARLLTERGTGGRGGTDTVVTIQRWRDRSSYEAYRHDAGMESARKIIPLRQEVEHCLPVGALGDPSEATTHFFVRIPGGADSEFVAAQLRASLEYQSQRAPGFLGAQVFLNEKRDEVFGLLSWRDASDFVNWRKSPAGQAGAAWLLALNPRVWKLTQVERVLGLAFK